LLDNDYSGEYISLADYEAQQAEIARLQAILQQWQQISPDLAVESPKFPNIWIRTHRLNVLIENTIEVLK
jgi:hypothetical protein